MPNPEGFNQYRHSEGASAKANEATQTARDSGKALDHMKAATAHYKAAQEAVKVGNFAQGHAHAGAAERHQEEANHLKAGGAPYYSTRR
jgi:hypothetical protein